MAYLITSWTRYGLISAICSSSIFQVNIDVALVLRIMGDNDREGDTPWNVFSFVHYVTARGLQQQLADAQAEAVRTLARSVTHTEVFGLRNVGKQEIFGVKRGIYGTSISPTVPGGPGSSAAVAAGAAAAANAVEAMGAIMEDPNEAGMDAGIGANETKDNFVDEELGLRERLKDDPNGQEEKDLLGDHV